MAQSNFAAVAAIILAGGQGRRLGGVEKGLVALGGIPLIAHVIGRVRPQVGPIAINANTSLAAYAGFGLPVVGDRMPGWPGPLAGLEAGFEWLAAAAPAVEWLLSVPCDAPDLPADLVARLAARAAGAPGTEVVTAMSGGREHPVCAIWHRSLAGALGRDLAAGHAAVGRWAASRRRLLVDFTTSPFDPFFNINDAAALEAAERRLG